MKTIFVSLIVFLFSPLIFAQAKVCGDTKINIQKTGEWEDTRFIVNAENDTNDMKLVLNSVDFVSSFCEQSVKGQNKILVLARCGGSGCSESTYIVIDAKTLMVELVPFRNRGNLELVEDLLGRKVQH
ncbi:MAG: hypothetical protein H7A09_04345 [Oceanospirillaceae bacterium]|nr:hypothetical protein [Oceanospirillaceae bacterium]MCP5334858.1 hypothetical protein [Oceanospirillaceae bacterium]MCP5349529.1 hypothetical protein [Oceanospirillaceae bacterium]